MAIPCGFKSWEEWRLLADSSKLIGINVYVIKFTAHQCGRVGQSLDALCGTKLNVCLTVWCLIHLSMLAYSISMVEIHVDKLMNQSISGWAKRPCTACLLGSIFLGAKFCPDAPQTKSHPWPPLSKMQCILLMCWLLNLSDWCTFTSAHFVKSGQCWVFLCV